MVVALVAGAMSVVMTVLRSAGFSVRVVRPASAAAGWSGVPPRVDGGWIAPSEQSEIPRPGDGLGTARHAELGEDVVDVALDVGSVKGSTSAAAVAVGGPVGSGFLAGRW